MHSPHFAIATLFLVAATADGQSTDSFVPVTDAMLQNPDLPHSIGDIVS
jgi:hypothetical protein